MAFSSCDLVSIEIPSTVTDLGSLAFFDCSELKEVMLNEGLQMIGIGALDKCASLYRIIFPSTLTEIEHGAFYGCAHLEEVVLNIDFGK